MRTREGAGAKILKKLEAAFAAFKESYAGLSDSQLVEPGVMGDWSVKDIIGHVSAWEEETLKHLPRIIEGGRTTRYVTYGGVDTFNAQMVEQWRGLSLPETQRRLDETHRRLVELIETVSDDHFDGETRARRRLRLDTYGHYPEHAAAIRKWREPSFAR